MGKLTVIKRIEGYPGYLVTSDGRVLSTLSGKVKELKPGLSGSARLKYQTVVLYKDGVKKRFRVHRLVATAFHGPCPDGMECCHNDGNRFNNHRDNLRWDIKKNNTADRKIHGTCCSITKKVSGSKNGKSKLTEIQIQQIRAAYTTNQISQKALGNQYGVSDSAINRIVNCKNWTHI
jgi:hypothetical protein